MDLVANIGIYIDGDSINPDYLENIIKEINIGGRILISNIYADWSSPSKKNILTTARYNGITTIQADLISGKNSTDIKLAVDVMHTLYNIPSIDIFYLVVNDYDYRHLVPYIKQQCKKVHCIGTDQTNKSLINICDQFTYIKNIIKSIDSCTQVRGVKPINHDIKVNNDDVQASIVQFVRVSNNETDLSKLKNMLTRTHKFDIRDTEYKTFKAYVSCKYGKIIKISSCSKALVSLI
tara:strand:- start:3756 stop:4463 length:708 start_codon:yes stop_codon:yes gene_type:complete